MSKPVKVPFNVKMDADLVHRLKVHATLSDRSASDIIADLIAAHVPAYTFALKPEAGGSTP